MPDVGEDPRRLLFAHLYREGRLDEARSFAQESMAATEDPDERLAWMNNLALVERKAGNTRQALSLQLVAARLVTPDSKPPLVARHWLGLANTYIDLAELEDREGNLDRALVGLEGAREFFQLAEDEAAVAKVENNIAFILISLGRTTEAFPHLEAARKHFDESGEFARVAEIDDTAAQAYLRDNRLPEALECATRAANAVAGSDERLVLKDCLSTLSKVIEAFDREFDREQVRQALQEANGSIPRAAEILGITRQGLKWKLDNQHTGLRGSK